MNIYDQIILTILLVITSAYIAITANEIDSRPSIDQLNDSAAYITEGNAIGTAVAINDHTFLTVKHNVKDPNIRHYHIMNNGHLILADIAYIDPDSDLAILKTEDSINKSFDKKLIYPRLDCTDFTRPKSGDDVVSIGFPGGFGPLATFGKISADDPDIVMAGYKNEPYPYSRIVVNMPIYPGMSGSMVVDDHGFLLGLVTEVYIHQGLFTPMDYGNVVFKDNICDALVEVNKGK